MTTLLKHELANSFEKKRYFFSNVSTRWFRKTFKVSIFSNSNKNYWESKGLLGRQYTKFIKNQRSTFVWNKQANKKEHRNMLASSEKKQAEGKKIIFSGKEKFRERNCYRIFFIANWNSKMCILYESEDWTVKNARPRENSPGNKRVQVPLREQLWSQLNMFSP